MKLKNPFPVWDKKKILVTSLFLAAVLILSILIGALNITVTANISGREYSIDNIVSHNAAISEKEHSIYDQEAAEEVRGYISGALYGYGIENETITHLPRLDYNEKTQEFTYPTPKNIYAEIAGTSGVNILLIAHYDSCPYKIKYGEASEGSHGAIDDGYGVSVLLELARIYSKEANLKNGIKFAFVDGEESGLLGSYALVKEYADWLKDVNFVINVEARGETGPVYLFQTSDNNEKIIEFYKNAGFPYTFSIASDVYSMLPNDTDLSPFLENGYAGINLATLDSLKNYHNQNDVFATIDEASLAKYCDTLLPLLDEYAFNSKYSDMNYFYGSQNQLFFTLFPNALVNYSATTGWVFFAITLALIAVTVGLFIWKKKINIIKVLISLALDIGLLAALCGIGFIVALLSCAVCGVNYHFMFVIGVPADVGLMIAFIVISIAAVVVCTLLKRKLNITYLEMSTGALIFNGILSIVCAAVLFGGTFIFVIPALIFGLGALTAFIKNDKIKTPVAGTVTAVGSLFMLSFYVSLIYSLYLSLTFGALGLLLVFAAIPFMLCLPPAFDFYGKETQIKTPVSERDNKEAAV
ncbi:MAG: M28 family metallopeptidase [Roseburia sp.]|nr:M28 family metallopeptidase [Roseburia sp.]